MLILNINKRIKALRKDKGWNQKQLAALLGITQSGVSYLEQDGSVVSDQTIKSICLAVPGLNEKWLRDGTEPMFFETENTVIASLVSEYNLDTLDQKIVECYLNLGTLQRKVIKDYLRSLVDAVLSDESYGDYREEYINENASEVAARGGHSEQIGELKDLYDNDDSGNK